MSLSKEHITALKNEIVMAQTLNREELEPIMRENIQRYMGTHIPSFGVDWDIVLNEVYPIIQNNLPSTFFRNPRAFLKPRNKTYIGKKRNPVTGQMEDIQIDSAKSAKTQEDILNYSITEIKFKPEVRKTLLDALLFPFAIMWHGYKGDFGMTEESSIWIKDEKVFVKRVSPIRFIKDPSVNMSNLDEARWVGRLIDIPLQDLVEDDKLDVDKAIVKGFKGFGEKIGTASENAIKDASGGKDFIPGGIRKSMLDYADKEFQESKDSKFVQVQEIYLRPTKKEKREGKKGWILLLTDEQKKPLRVSEWKIKAEGFPAIPLIFNDLPDSQFGLSDVETYKQVIDQKNVVVNLSLRNVQENSKVWIGLSKEGANEEDIEHIQRGDQSIVTFESGNPKDRMFVASPGGAASQELYLAQQYIQKNLEDKSMMTDQKRGFLQSGEESAASAKIRNAGGNARPSYRQDIMADFLKDSLHYLNQLNKQFMPYKDAVRIVGSLDLEWSANPSKEELQADTDVDIDVISMLPENPEKELQELQTILTMMYQALTTPQILQKVRQEGKTINISPIVEQILLRLRLKNPDIYRNIKPEESEGFVSVQQIRQAKANVDAAVQGKQIPFPPKPEDDHVAKLEIYTAMQKLFQQMGQISETLNQLIQVQSALLQQVQEKQARPQPVKLPKAGVSTV